MFIQAPKGIPEIQLLSIRPLFNPAQAKMQNVSIPNDAEYLSQLNGKIVGGERGWDWMVTPARLGCACLAGRLDGLVVWAGRLGWPG
jgi:hypothetical protein